MKINFHFRWGGFVSVGMEGIFLHLFELHFGTQKWRRLHRRDFNGRRHRYCRPDFCVIFRRLYILIFHFKTLVFFVLSAPTNWSYRPVPVISARPSNLCPDLDMCIPDRGMWWCWSRCRRRIWSRCWSFCTWVESVSVRRDSIRFSKRPMNSRLKVCQMMMTRGKIRICKKIWVRTFKTFPFWPQ